MITLQDSGGFLLYSFPARGAGTSPSSLVYKDKDVAPPVCLWNKQYATEENKPDVQNGERFTQMGEVYKKWQLIRVCVYINFKGRKNVVKIFFFVKNLWGI